MKPIILVLILIISGGVGYQIYNLYGQKSILKKELVNLNKEIKPLIEENKQLSKQIDYLKKPENLEKELRKRFNYSYPDEELYVIISNENQ